MGKDRKEHLWLISLPLPGRTDPLSGNNAEEADRQRFGLYSILHDALVGAPNQASPGLNCHLTPLDLPNFRTGTLDLLVKASDELAVAEQRFLVALNRIIGSMSQLLNESANSDLGLIPKSKVSLSGLLLVGNGKTPESYARNFVWNAVKYRHDIPILEILETFNKIDELVKSKMSLYSSVLNELLLLDRKKHKANLLTRDLSDIASEHRGIESDYFETLFVVVPSYQRKEWFNTYEGGIVPEGVMPRSSESLIEDDDYCLVNVTVMKRNVQEFIQEAAKHKYPPPIHPRFIVRTDFKFDAQEMELQQQREVQLHSDLDSLWMSNLRLLKANFGETFSILLHVKILRACVESVLRYGLPSHFLYFTLKPAPKAEKKTRYALLQVLREQNLDGISALDIESILNNDDEQEDLSRIISPEDMEIMRSCSAASVDPNYDVFVKVDLALDLSDFIDTSLIKH